MSKHFVPLSGAVTGMPAVYLYDSADIGIFTQNNGDTFGRQRLAGEAIFNVTLTLQNVADGSRWRVEKASDGSTIDGGVQSGTGDINVSIGYTGTPLTVKIKVRKASGSPRYKPFETNAVVGATGGSSYVSQISDE